MVIALKQKKKISKAIQKKKTWLTIDYCDRCCYGCGCGSFRGYGIHVVVVVELNELAVTMET